VPPKRNIVFRVHQLPQKTKKPVGQNTLKEQRNRWKTEKTIAFFAITSSRGIESNEKTVTISPPRSDNTDTFTSN